MKTALATSLLLLASLPGHPEGSERLRFGINRFSIKLPQRGCSGRSYPRNSQLASPVSNWNQANQALRGTRRSRAAEFF